MCVNVPLVCVVRVGVYICVCVCIYVYMSFPLAQLVKNPPAMQETPVWFLGWEDSLEKGTATCSSILAWRTPWTELFMRSQRVTGLKDFHFSVQIAITLGSPGNHSLSLRIHSW